MNYTIKNQFISATVSGNGAELKELFDKENINRMHIPSTQTWNRVSPILFPFISRIKGGKYYVDGKPYEMPAHGFFRNMVLTPLTHTESSITFKITEDEETLKIYPYKFVFEVTYKVQDNKLIAEFEVTNTDTKDLLFMLGGHPGFEIANNENFTDYYLKFQQKETVQAMQVVDGFLANEFKPYLNDEDTINLKHDLFVPDAIVLKDLKSSYVDLLSKSNDNCIRFHFEGFEILAIWSLNDEKASFVCLEPWNGIQKDFVLDHDKMGVLLLKPTDKQKFSYTIEIVK